MEKGLIDKTGKDLAHWIRVVESSGLTKHREILNHLKSEYGFTHGFANFVALKALRSDAGSHDSEALVDNQYAKGKAHLRPIYQSILDHIQTFGDDITVTPKKDSVSLIRKKQFALVKPATKTRIDLGLKLKGKPTTDRLENSGPFGAMCTHRVRIEDQAGIDAELIRWLREAYDAAN